MSKKQINTVINKQDAMRGLEFTNRLSYSATVINIIQQDSKSAESYSPGMIYDTVGGRAFDDVRIIPCTFKQQFNRFTRTNGKFEKSGELTEAEVKDLMNDGIVREVEGVMYYCDDDGRVDKNSDIIRDQRNHYVLLLDDDGVVSEAIIPLHGSATGASKSLLSKLKASKFQGPYGEPFTPPTWANIVTMTTVKRTNADGKVWWVPKFELNGFVEDPELYKQGADYNSAVTSGLIKKASADNPVKTRKVPKLKKNKKKSK